MPELPEVETVRRGLSRLIIGKVIKGVAYDFPKGFPNAQSDIDQFLVGAGVLEVRRRAKVLMIDLSSEYTLVIHLKMTGQLVYVGEGSRFGAGHPNDSLVGQLPDRSTRITFEFDDGSHLYFNDQRKFGWARLFPTLEVPNIDFMRSAGPEPLSDDFTPEEFTERFARRSKSNIKAALLDQTVVAGVGNIYADESLFMAKIHPTTRVGDITEEQFYRLYHAVRESMFLSLEKGGSTDKNYVDAEGQKGSYLNHALVFRKEGQPCPRCGEEIIKTRVAGRGTHVCPKCQKKAVHND